MFAELGTSVAKSILKKLTAKAIRSIDDLIKSAKLQKATKGSAIIYQKKGGYIKAKQDFNTLKKYADMKNVEKLKNSKYKGYTGKIGDIKVVLRSGSKSSEATLELQYSKSKVIKIRYPFK